MFSVLVKKGKINGSFVFPWKVGIVTNMAYPNLSDPSQTEAIVQKLCEDEFYDVLEMPPLPEGVWESVAPRIKRSGKEIIGCLQSLVIQQYNISSVDEVERSKAVGHINDGVKTFAQRGARLVAISSGPDPGPTVRRPSSDALTKSLIEIASYAERLGVWVILETFDRLYDKKLLMGPIQEVDEVIRSVRSTQGNMGILWDLSHAPLIGETSDALEKYPAYISHVHIGCAKQTDQGLKDWHPGFHRPGAINTEVEVTKLLGSLSRIGFDGIISVEVKPEEGQEPEEIVSSSKGALYTAFARYVIETLTR